MNQNPQTPNAGPKALTIEEYKARQKKRSPKEPFIPESKKPKRRGGYVWKLKKELSILHRSINTKPPPTWEIATQLWNRVNEVEFLISQYLSNRKGKSIN